MNDFNYQDDHFSAKRSRSSDRPGGRDPLLSLQPPDAPAPFPGLRRRLCGGASHVCFAVKANSNTAILRIFVREGGGMDLVSGGSSTAP